MIQTFLSRVKDVAPVPEFVAAVERRLAVDRTAAAEHLQFGGVIPALYTALGGTDDDVLHIWLTAWAMLSGFWQEFDHYTDGDSQSDVETFGFGIALNGVVGYVFAAAAVLDDLQFTTCGTTRVCRLRRLWNDNVLRTVAGQHRDLEAIHGSIVPPTSSRARLTASQDLARLKAGALYALAFGGTAMLRTDDQVLIDILQRIGEMYGMLLMHADDVRDVNDPNESPFSFAHTFLVAAPGLTSADKVSSPEDFFGFVYQQYLAHIGALTAQLPRSLHGPIRQVFAQTFEQQDRNNQSGDPRMQSVLPQDGSR